MKSITYLLTLLMTCGITLAQSATAQQTAPPDEEISVDQPPAHQAHPADAGWPREFTSHDRQFTVYQPQVESWDKTTLQQRSAVSVQKPGSSTPLFGVIWMKARTDVDKTTHLVSLEDVQITKGSFPTAGGQEKELLATLKSELPRSLQPIALDRLEASLGTRGAETPKAAPRLKNEAPQIIYSSSPALLIPIDGKPVLRDSGAPKLKQVVNTRALIEYDEPHGMYYLWLGDRWMRSPSLENGPWHPAENVQPSVVQELEQARQAALAKGNVDQLEGQAGREPQARGEPKIFVTTRPSELVETQGPAQFTPVPRTGLLYVTNTGSDLFLYTQDQKYYVLISGRWYRSDQLSGSWEYVSPKKLPSDFAKIPEQHPKGDVLASVAGTPQAKEAVISNEIPQTATIDRGTTGESVTYDGAPQFVPIQGTPLLYSPNTPIPVIEVSPSSYYCVQNGVWFDAPTPNGPWHVSTYVPSVIYTIPPSSPLYYVTYVYVYQATPQYVYVGYLPGYLGSYVTPDGVVVYGTGWYYPPWIGAVWYGPPLTYGFGVTWGIGFGWSLHVGPYAGYWGGACVHPWWGPYHWYAHHWPQGHYGTVHINVNRANVYRHWQPGVVHSTWARHDFARPRGSPAAYSHAARPNNLYSDRGGHVYRHGTQGWERYGSSGWQRAPNPIHEAPRANTTRPGPAPYASRANPTTPHPGHAGRTGGAPSTPATRAFSGVYKAPAPPRELDLERQARSRGDQRASQWGAPQRNGPMTRPTAPPGGFHAPPAPGGGGYHRAPSSIAPPGAAGGAFHGGPPSAPGGAFHALPGGGGGHGGGRH